MAQNPPYHGADVVVDHYDDRDLHFVIRGKRTVHSVPWGDERWMLPGAPTTVQPSAGSAGALYLSNEYCAANRIDVRGMPKVPAYLAARRYHGKMARVVGMTTHFTLEGDPGGRVYSVDLGDRVSCAAHVDQAGGLTAVTGVLGEAGEIDLSDDWLDAHLVSR